MLAPCWMVIFFKAILAHVVLWSRYLGLSAVQHILTIVWCWWQVPCALTFSSQPPPWRPSSKKCLGQHVNRLRLHLWMFDQPLLGGWTILCLIFFPGPACLLAENLVNIFASPLSWTFSYPLLSLSQACKHAQEHVFVFTCCWHLDPLPRLRDEVKEECPIVYEENFSETNYSCLLSCLSLFFCYISAHQQLPSIHDLSAEPWTTLKVFVGVKQAPWATISVSLIIYYSGLYCCLLGISIRHCFSAR